jgi:hypothetical protein
MKLNGWNRIGIIISVIWIIGVGYRIYDSEVDRASVRKLEAQAACDSTANRLPDQARSIPDPREVPIPPGAHVEDSTECNKRAGDAFGLFIVTARKEAAAFALIPVPLGWAFAYIALFLVRWVKRGFMLPM